MDNNLEPGYTELKYELMLVKKDIEVVDKIIAKLDNVVDKIQDAIGTVTTMISINKNNIESLEDEDKNLSKRIDDLTMETKESVKDLQARIDKLHSSIVDGQKESENRIKFEIRDVKKSLDKRISELEAGKRKDFWYNKIPDNIWKIIGGILIAAVAFIASNWHAFLAFASQFI